MIVRAIRPATPLHKPILLSRDPSPVWARASASSPASSSRCWTAARLSDDVSGRRQREAVTVGSHRRRDQEERESLEDPDAAPPTRHSQPAVRAEVIMSTTVRAGRATDIRTSTQVSSVQTALRWSGGRGRRGFRRASVPAPRTTSPRRGSSASQTRRARIRNDPL